METTYLIGIRQASPLLEAEVRLRGREHAVDLVHLLLDVKLGPDVHVAVRDELLGVGHVEVEGVHAAAVHQPLHTPPLKKAIPRSLGSTISQKPCSKRTPTDSEYDVG